jgi:hypothetical protein
VARPASEEQALQENYDPSGLDGFWVMDLSESKTRDPDTGEWVPEVIRQQFVEIRHEGEWADFRVRIDHAEDLHLYMHYRVRYGDDEWVPYTVVHIDGDPEHEKLRPNLFRTVHARVGQPISYLKEVYVDPRTTFRLTRHIDGKADYALMSRLSEDRQRIVGKVFPVEGQAGIEKWMQRVDSLGFDWPA